MPFAASTTGSSPGSGSDGRRGARLEEILREDGEEPPLRTWDWRYCDTRLRRRDFAVDPDELRAYLPLEAVFDGLLGLCAEVLRPRFERIEDAAAWHPDVHRFRVRDAATGAEIGDVLMDLHPRDGKYGHAAAWPLVPGRRLADGTYQRPLTAIVANLPRPTAGRARRSCATTTWSRCSTSSATSST